MNEKLIARVLTPAGDQGSHLVEVRDGILTLLEPTESPAETTIIPGLADLHTHGAVGGSFPNSDLDGCIAAARHHRSNGTTTLLASTVSLPESVLLPQLSMLAEAVERDEIDGIHAEGPFVNSCRCGAQDPAAIIPGDPELFARMISAAGGHLRSMTFAPETPNARELIDQCVAHDIIVSFGHTDASADVVSDAVFYAIERGATVTATHLFNAMPPLLHREPGPVAALLSAAGKGEAVVELIADGVHLADSTVDMVLSTVGAGGVTFVSDAMEAAGEPDGQYKLGALDVTVTNGVARLSTEDGSEGAIAGGTSRVIDQVFRQIDAGQDIAHVLTACTSGHHLLGKSHRSCISQDQPANFIVLNSDFNVARVYREGKVVG